MMAAYLTERKLPYDYDLPSLCSAGASRLT